MRPEILLVSRNTELTTRLTVAFGERLEVVHSWFDHLNAPLRVLIVDAASLTPLSWAYLQEFSRQQPRPAIILVDDGLAEREHLARVAADILVPPGSDEKTFVCLIQEHLWDQAFQLAAQQILDSSSLPYPLSLFLAAAISSACRKVSTLARSLGVSQSTVRNQWRVCRSESSVRLEDILHRAIQIRKSAVAKPSGTWRTELDELVEVVLEGHQR